MHLRKMKDVFVTDHEKKPEKFATISPADDEQFFNYKKALAEYNSDA
jgi:hypothetical protein